MSRDFTLDKYRELCTALIECGYSPLTVCDYLERRHTRDSPLNNIAIIRHDIDRKIRNALCIAELEHTLDIQSSFYFRYPDTFKPEIVQKIRDLGHEIGYHYEAFVKAKGDPVKAIHIFEMELCSMREIFDIKTICMHGNPMSRYDNRDLWQHYDFKDFKILGEAYLSFQGADIQYLTDTGRNWNGMNSLRDNMPGTRSNSQPVQTTDNLIDWIKNHKKTSLYLTVHPERWTNHNGEWVINYTLDHMVNCGKKILMMVR
ncbi:hypothetical protein Metfor_1398 [Methanoregula formicica SMSP]|uniref:Xylanase/chitin deacetylase n=1 Tax=Methanoregula formicica (strain DSM 22288 / NBRC 105244 / SMSP) TaxID=593750 RepID=L0HF62_METFS|nr:hypothetical protein Metfor_1398 [Methanoregula formicica SMSP]